MEKKKAYQAYGNAGKVTRDTPRQAAIAYFAEFSRSRKCNITEGQCDGQFFVVTYGRKSLGEWPAYWRDVTKTMAATLPDEVQP